MDMYDPDTIDDIDLADWDAWSDDEAIDLDDEDGWWQSLGSGLVSAAEGAYNRNWSKSLSTAMNKRGMSKRSSGLADSAIRGALGGLRIFFNAPNLKEDGDPYEPEYESDAIDEMEALLEDALAGDETDAALSADEMVARSFGAMRGVAQVRPLMAALSREVRRMVMMARRNPRLRNVARLAPLALRRTAVVLMKLLAARRPVNMQLAQRVFRGVLARLARSQQMRSVALRRARHRSRRAAGRGRARAPRPGYGGYPGAQRQLSAAGYGF